MYRTISNDVKELLTSKNYDIICFFTPSGVKSLFDNFPEFKQNGTRIGAFGNNTSKAVEEAGLTLGYQSTPTTDALYGGGSGAIPRLL